MQYDSLEELIGLPEEVALSRNFTARNYRRLRQFAGAAALLAFLVLLFELVEGNYMRLLAPVAILGLSRWLFVSGEKQFLERHFRPLLIAFVL